MLPPSQTSLDVGALPAGLLHAILYTQINGAWTGYQSIWFTALPTEAGLTSPSSGQVNVSPTASFTWTTATGVDGYALWIGTTRGSADVFGTGLLPPTQSSLAVPTLPSGRTLYAILFTRRNGAWYQHSISFTTAGAAGGAAAHDSPRPVNQPPLSANS